MSLQESIDIRIREDGSRVVERGIRGMGQAADDSAGSIDLLKRALTGLAAGLAISKLQDWADSWGTASGLIRTSTKSIQEATAVQDQLFKVAQKTRTEYGAVVELYSRSARAANDLGASQQDLINFTEGVGKALAVQHTSATQAAGALFQLGQALTGAKIQAQEYNSLIDNAPVILQTVAQHLDGTGGSIGGLTKLVKSGKVSNKEFFDAFLAGSADLDAKFQQTTNLFSQGWTIISNAVIKYVGQMNEALGISDAFKGFGDWVAANMPAIAAGIAGLGVAIAVALAPTAIMETLGALKLLWALIAANPITALIATVAGLATSIYMMRDQITLGVDDVTTLGDLMRAVFEQLGPLLEAVGGTIEQVFINLRIAVGSAYDDIFNEGENYEHKNEAMWLKVLRAVARTIDAIVGLFIGLYDAAKRIFSQLGDNISSTFSNAFEGLKDFFTGDFAGAAAAAKQNIATWQATGDQLASAFTDGLDTGFGAMKEGGFEAHLDSAIKRAQEIAKQRAAQQGGNGVDLGGHGKGGGNGTDPNAAKAAAKALADLKRELAQLKDKADPVGAAMRDLAEAQKTFDKAVQAHLISGTEAERLMGRLRKQYEEQLDPLKFMNDELDRHNGYLKMNNEQAQIESELYDRVQYLQRQGVDLTNAEVEALRAKLVVNQQLERIANERDRMQQDSTGEKMKQFMDQITAMKQLLADAQSGFTQGDALGQVQRMLPWADLSGTQEQMNAYVELHATMYQQIDALRQQDIISESTANNLRMQADAQLFEQRIAGQRAFFGALAGLSSSSNRKLAAIGKAAAVTQATIDGIAAVQKAYTSVPYPWNIPAAVAQGALAAANVAQIMSTPLPGYRTGGEFMVGGGGVSDSQVVAFRATPGERVTVTPPGQQGPSNQAPAAPTQVKLTALNVLDPSIVGQYLSTPEGEQVLVNVMAKNGYAKAE